jgi:hypothetical protein
MGGSGGQRDPRTPYGDAAMPMTMSPRPDPDTALPSGRCRRAGRAWTYCVQFCRSWPRQTCQCGMRGPRAPPLGHSGNDRGCVPALLFAIKSCGQCRVHPGEVRRGEDAVSFALAVGAVTGCWCGPYRQLHVEPPAVPTKVFVGRHGHLHPTRPLRRFSPRLSDRRRCGSATKQTHNLGLPELLRHCQHLRTVTVHRLHGPPATTTASASPRHFDKDQAMAILDVTISAQKVIVSYCLRDQLRISPGPRT